MIAKRAVEIAILIVSLLILRGPAAGEDKWKEVEFKGIAAQLPGSSLAGDWVIAGLVVRVSSNTKIESGKGAPAVGALMKVKGKRDSNGVVFAKEMKVEQAIST